MRLSGRIVCAVVGLALAVPAGAQAMVVRVDANTDISQGGKRLIYVEDKVGEANLLSVVRDGTDVLLSDVAAPITHVATTAAGDPCTNDTPNTVRCPLSAVTAPATSSQLTISAGDGDDVLDVSGSPLGAAATGQAGDDLLFGSPRREVLTGGTGDDYLVPGLGADGVGGGPGSDWVDYSQRTAPVNVDLSSAQPLNGEAGEGDRLSDVENAVGGSGNDTLAGSASANDLDGGPGADVLIGNAGTDRLDTGTGSDTVRAADGEVDKLVCEPNRAAKTLDVDPKDDLKLCPDTGGGAAATEPPVVRVAPTVTGSLTVGGSLRADPGVWAGTPTPTLKIQWYACDDPAGQSCTALAGQTAATLTLAPSLSGRYLKVRVTATSSAGTAERDSSLAGPVSLTAQHVGTALECGGRDALLMSIARLPGRRLLVIGAAKRGSARRTVAWYRDGKRVATSRVSTVGLFQRILTLPRGRETTSVIQARLLGKRTNTLKSGRRLTFTSLSAANNAGVSAAGRASAPWRAGASVVLEACGPRRNWVPLATTKLTNTGRFTKTFAMPAGTDFILLRARTTVLGRRNRDAKRGTITTYTEPRIYERPTR